MVVRKRCALACPLRARCRLTPVVDATQPLLCQHRDTAPLCIPVCPTPPESVPTFSATPLSREQAASSSNKVRAVAAQLEELHAEVNTESNRVSELVVGGGGRAVVMVVVVVGGHVSGKGGLAGRIGGEKHAGGEVLAVGSTAYSVPCQGRGGEMPAQRVRGESRRKLHG